ncbi:MaoC family dehydratase [Halomarina halobia]|uniref:MaoC family dehydratase n=1 Tax=Halomarina halobia TaxID=3033386 RepID=A0ABD6AD21_9EURY|nr:MaoC family dehydratase [Halomarina sp. PSR21]
MQYYEDVEVGETEEFGEYQFDKEEIIEFAEKYDPQPFHTDEEAARESVFGELVASGWQTAAVCMRMLVDGYLRDQASMGARGVDELRWLKPVKPGDTLHIRAEIVDKRLSESNPHRGYVDNKMEGVNQDGEVVISWIGLGMMEVRDPDV